MAYFSLGYEGFTHSANSLELTEDPFINAGIVQSQNALMNSRNNVILDPNYENISDDDFDVTPSQARYVPFIYWVFI